MKKAFFNQFGKERVNVVGFMNEEGNVDHYFIHVGYFTLALDGTEENDDIRLQYPTKHDHVAYAAYQLHNDEELERIVYSLLEITDYLDNQPIIRQIATSDTTLPTTITNLQQFEEACRKIGVLTYENRQVFSALQHDETEYQSDKPYLVVLTDETGSELEYHQIDDKEAYPLNHVYPNAPQASVKSYTVHLGSPFVDIRFVVLNGEDVHFHFPVHVYEVEQNFTDCPYENEYANYEPALEPTHTFDDMNSLLHYSQEQIQHSLQVANEKGLSLYSSLLLQRMDEKELREKIAKRHLSKTFLPIHPSDKKRWADSFYEVFSYRQHEVYKEEDEIILPF